MIYELHFILIAIFLFILVFWGILFYFDYRKHGLNYNIFFFIIIVFLSLYLIPDIINFFYFFLYKSQDYLSNLDFSVFLYLFSLITLLIFPIIVAALSIFAQVEFKKRNFYLLAFFAAYVLVIIYIMINSKQTNILDGGYTYISVMLQESLFVIVLGLSILFPTVPYLITYLRIVKKVRSKGVKIRMHIVTSMVYVKTFKIILLMVIGNSWLMIIIGDLMDIISVSIMIIILFDRNFVNRIFMLLNTESVYISDGHGVTLYNSIYISGKNKDTHDKFVGGLIMGSDEVVKEIMITGKAGLSRIILNDATAIIFEKSEISGLFYSVFTRRYTKFTHDKVLELKSMIDEEFSKTSKDVKDKFDPNMFDIKIIEIFLK